MSGKFAGLLCRQISHVPTAEVLVATNISGLLEDSSQGWLVTGLLLIAPHSQRVAGNAKARTPPHHPEYTRYPLGPTCLRFPLRSPEAKCWPSGLTCMTRTPAFTSIGIPFSLPRSGKCDMSCRCWMSFSTYTTFSRVCRKERAKVSAVSSSEALLQFGLPIASLPFFVSDRTPLRIITMFPSLP